MFRLIHSHYRTCFALSRSWKFMQTYDADLRATNCKLPDSGLRFPCIFLFSFARSRVQNHRELRNNGTQVCFVRVAFVVSFLFKKSKNNKRTTVARCKIEYPRVFHLFRTRDRLFGIRRLNQREICSQCVDTGFKIYGGNVRAMNYDIATH